MADETALETESRYRGIFNQLDVGLCTIKVKFDAIGQPEDYRFLQVNPAFGRQTGIDGAEGRWISDLALTGETHWFDMCGEVAKTGEPIRFEAPSVAPNRYFDVYAFRIDAAEEHHVALLFNDISERREFELSLKSLNDTLEQRVAERARQLEAAQEALRQSQKMEAIGQLTGGIAHDFNNLLAGIIGSLELLETRIGQGRLDGVERYLTTAQQSAGRAASLTQRLLAFARRQTLDPRPVDVNRMIASMSDLLNRSVGPNVKLEVVQAGGLWTTLLDNGQLENALLNLCINARDAMAPNGGVITIETANKWLDDRTARERDLPPGQYVSLCVTDTGTGMSPDLIDRAFDPFFTTKPLGQGTGLGLSMVYGFVRQSGGQVRIYSEVGRGTTMCLYFPRNLRSAADFEAPELVQVTPGAGETILLIDDEAAIRMLVTDALEENGYHVIVAEDGVMGLKILERDIEIDLLVTDVGLPGGLNGRQVADAGRRTRPTLKVLFITGYAENAVVGNGHLDHGMSVITKPFAMTAIAAKVREVIDTSPQGDDAAD